MLKRWLGGLALMTLMLSGAAAQAQGIFDGMLDRAKESAEHKARDRVNQRIDQTIDKRINKTEETMQCVATDQECLKRAKEQGKQVTVVNAPAASRSSLESPLAGRDRS